jgi:ribosomal protein L40E
MSGIGAGRTRKCHGVRFRLKADIYSLEATAF